jgi:beta-lactamase regulating signal transducer with metallopeptidase domain
MGFSSSSIITTLLISNLSIIAVWFLLRSHKLILRISVGVLLVGILLMLLRLLLPFEFTFQFTLFDKHILPYIFLLFYYPVYETSLFSIYLYHILLVIWICGIIIYASKIISAYIIFKKVVDREPYNNEKNIINIIKEVESLYGKNANIFVIRTSIVSVPLLFGINQPKILLPQIEYSNEDLNYIIRHELTHYYQHDLWIKFFVEFASVIYWWNPFVYILKQQIDKILEIRVDAKVTKLMSEEDKINYLDCLLRIAKGKAPLQTTNFSLAFDSRASSVLAQRFYIVLDNKYKQKSRLFSLLLFVFTMIIIFLLLFVVIEPYSIAQKDEENTVELSTETSFLVVNSDGSYDIYLNKEYFGTVSEIKDSYSNLCIYKNLEEALINDN